MPPAPDDPDQVFSTIVRDVAGTIVDGLERLPIPIWITDRNGRVGWTNLAATNIFGSVSGVHFSRLIAPDRMNDARELFARRILGAPDAMVHATVLLAVAGRVAAEIVSVPLRHNDDVVAVAMIVRADRADRAEGDHDGLPPPRPLVTRRQLEVLELLAYGLSEAEISSRLELSDEIIREDIRLLLSEFGVESWLEAVAVAFRHGWV